MIDNTQPGSNIENSNQIPSAAEILTEFGVTPEMFEASGADLIFGDIEKSFATYELPQFGKIRISVESIGTKPDTKYIRRNILITEGPVNDFWIKTYTNARGEYLRQVWIRGRNGLKDESIRLEIPEKDNSLLKIGQDSLGLKTVGQFTMRGQNLYLQNRLVIPDQIIKQAGNVSQKLAETIEQIPHGIISAMISGQLHRDLSPWFTPDALDVNIVQLGEFKVPLKVPPEA